MGSRTSGRATRPDYRAAVADGLPATLRDDRQTHGQGLADEPGPRHPELLDEQVEIRQMAAREAELDLTVQGFPIVEDGG